MSVPLDEQAAARAAARASWPVRRCALGEEPSDDLSASTSAEERLAMMWPLAVEAWTLAGRSTEARPRDRMPVTVYRSDGPSVERGSS